MHARSTSVSYNLLIEEPALLNDDPEEKKTEHESTSIVRSAKLSHLDGVRGLCAFGVVLWHWVCLFTKYEEVYWGQTPPGSFWILPFINGPIFVTVFFVLSGRVLSDAIYNKVERASGTGDHGQAVRAIISACIRRPFRLILPILGLVYSIMFLQKTTDFAASAADRIDHFINPLSIERYHQDASSPLWVQPSDGVGWSVNASLIDGFTMVIQTVVLQNSSIPWYNVLWTMATELRGSYVVFALSIFGVSLKRGSHLILLIVLGCTVFLRHPTASFVVGVIITHLRYKNVLSAGSSQASSMTVMQRIAWSGLLIPGILIACTTCPPWNGGVRPFKDLWIQLIVRGVPYQSLELLAATSLVLCSEISSTVQSFLNCSLCQFLGRISYALYLIHLALWTSFGTWLFQLVFTSGRLEYNLAAFVCLLPSLAIALGLSYIFTVLIDDPSVRLARWLGGYFLVHGDKKSTDSSSFEDKALHIRSAAIQSAAKFWMLWKSRAWGSNRSDPAYAFVDTNDTTET